MNRNKLINQLIEILLQNDINNDTDLTEYDMWLNDGDGNGEDHLITNIINNDGEISFIVNPDLDEYSINDLSCEEICLIIDSLQ